MPWHERWFYLDWILDAAAEASSTEEAFDPNKPWTGGVLSPDVAAALGANVRMI